MKKKNLISAFAGACTVGLIWIISAFFVKPAAPDAGAEPPPEAAAEKVTTPVITKEEIKNAYSSLPMQRFAGLKLYQNDFLIPVNRMHITNYFVFDDPKDDYGSGNMPMYAFVFYINEKNNYHYFMIAGAQNKSTGELIYLGQDISVDKFEHVGNGYIMVSYHDSQKRAGKGIAAVSYICGSKPKDDPGISQSIELDPFLNTAEKCDPFVWKITASALWKLLRRSVKANDKLTIAKMISFPLTYKGEKIYTRAEFIENFDKILDDESKNAILNAKDDDRIFYSWRGAMLPNSSWLQNAPSAKDPAGPLSL